MVELREALGKTLSEAHRAYAAFRPEVAEYLFERGFRVLLSETRDPPLLTAIFRLQMESIGSRAFGVSNDAWRENPEWPDRYFPILWIDLVPRLLPLLPPDRRLASIVLLFNLGENLVTAAPTLGGVVAEALLRALPGMASDVERAAISALADVGLLPREALARSGTPRALSRVASISLALWDPLFIPGAVGFEGDTTWIADRARPLAVHVRGNQLVARVATESIREPSILPCRAGDLALAGDGELSVKGMKIGQIDPRGVAGVALSARGHLAVARKFSQIVELWSAS